MDEIEIADLKSKLPTTKRNWILLRVTETDKTNAVGQDSKVASPTSLKFRPKTNVASKIDGINALNNQISDYYRRRFGGDLSTRPMSTGNIPNGSPHSFRRFSSTSVDDLTLKSKFQALQWKFRNEIPLTVKTSTSNSNSNSPSFRRKAGRLVDQSFEFIDSELKQSQNQRGLRRARELEMKLPTKNSAQKTNYYRRKPADNHLLEYSSNSGEVYAVYAKRNDDVLSQRRNVQFDDKIKVLERYQTEPTTPVTTGGFVRQLCAIVKPHKRTDYSTTKLNVISAYGPPKPVSPSDLESFYSIAKTCTLPSLADETVTPDDLESAVGNHRNGIESTRDVIYSADVDHSCITENPAFRDDTFRSGRARRRSNEDDDANKISTLHSHSITQENPSVLPKRNFIIDEQNFADTTPYDALKSKSFVVAAVVIIFVVILAAVGVALTVLYD